MFKNSSEISSRGPLSNLDVTTNAMVPASMGSLDLPPSLSILPPQRTSMSPVSATMGMLQQPLHMAMWGQAHASISNQMSHSVAIPVGLPTQHGSLSRALVNTMGKLGRWKRVLNSRSAPVQSQLDCSGVSSFDIEQGYAGDLQIFRQPYGDLGQRVPGSVSKPFLSNDLIPPNDVVRESDEKRSSGLLSTLEETTEPDADVRTPQPSILLPRNGDSSTEDSETLTRNTAVSQEESIGEAPHPFIDEVPSEESPRQLIGASPLTKRTDDDRALETASRHPGSSVVSSFHFVNVAEGLTLIGYALRI